MTAAWLVQMGHRDVLVWADDLKQGEVEQGLPAPQLLGMKPHVEEITAQALRDQIVRGGVAVADCDGSLRYREGHVPGAWHVVRSRLKDHLGKIPPAELLVFTSPDGLLATYATADAARLTRTPVRVLAGGTAAWSAAGYELEAGDARMTGDNDDVRYRALDQKGNVENAIREYLQWEVDLLNAVSSDPDFGFRRFPQPAGN
jgi:3-mercaptopyruvate sulfurtransferase SseA